MIRIITVALLLSISGVMAQGNIAQAQSSEEDIKNIKRGIETLEKLAKAIDYLSFRVGKSSAMDDGKFDLPHTWAGTREQVKGTVKIKPSTAYLLEFGRKMWGGRLGIELSYRENKISDFDYERFKIPGQNASLNNYGILLNYIYEIELESTNLSPYLTRLRPYFLGGLGASVVHYDWDHKKSLPRTTSGQVPLAIADVSTEQNLSERFRKDSNLTWGLAWQAGGGIRYPIWKALSLNISYRWFSTPDVKFVYPATSNEEEKANFMFKNTHHAGMVGLTIDF